MNFRNVTATLLLIAAGSTAQAASLALIPSAGTVVQNTPFTVDLVLNALDLTDNQPGTFGGKVVVSFNPALLTFGTFVLTPGVPNLLFFSNPAVATSSNQQTVTFGFDFAPVTGVVGKFTFTPVGSPGSIATLGLRDFSQTTGTFFQSTPTNRPVAMSFNGTQVTISAVPLPAGVWLLGTGVGVLLARRRFPRATH